jgi:hypothetical protein
MMKSNENFDDSTTVVHTISFSSSSASTNHGRMRRLENPKMVDMDYRMLRVHENLKNLPIFY